MKKATRPAIFKWRQTAPELILCAVRWYLRYSPSLRDVEELLEEHGLKRIIRPFGAGTALWSGTGSAATPSSEADQQILACR
jgi:hypothetical protein